MTVSPETVHSRRRERSWRVLEASRNQEQRAAAGHVFDQKFVVRRFFLEPRDHKTKPNFARGDCSQETEAMFNEWKMLQLALKSFFTDKDDTPLLTPYCVTASGLESEAKRLKKKIDKALAEGLNELGSN